MSLRVSYISEYMFCPLKLYLRHHIDEKDKLNQISQNNRFIQLRKDSHDLIRRNLYSVKNDMNYHEIEQVLIQDMAAFIKKSAKIYELEAGIDTDIKYKNENGTENKEYWENEENNGNNGNRENIEATANEVKHQNYLEFEKLKEEIALEIKIMALRASKIIKNTKKEGPQINEMLFPPSLERYLIHDKSLNIAGNIDKIEIMDGKYFPVKIKTGQPPLRGVWDSDSLEIAAYGILLEQEFDTEVLVGFVEYLSIGDRKPVVIDSDLREGLFSVLDDIREIVMEGAFPEVEVNPNRCTSCSYMEICHQIEDS